MKDSAAKKGKKLSESHKKSLVENHGKRGRINSDAHKAALIASRVGSKHSDESKEKMSKTRKQRKDLKELAAAAGKTSAEKYKLDPERQKAHSERMKKWWADKKAAESARGG